jgi:hypothetical protein
MKTAQYLCPRDAAYYLGVSRYFLARLRKAGTGPSWVRLNRLIRYPVAALDAYVTARTEGGNDAL